MSEKIKKEMYMADDMIDKLRVAFQKQDTQGDHLLNDVQLFHVFKSLGIKMSNEEFGALFKEIDVDGN